MSYRETLYKSIYYDPELKKNELSIQAREDTLDIFTHAMEEFEQKRVLDFYCGTGKHAALLAEKGYRVIVAETSVEALKITAERAKMYDVSLELTSMTSPFSVKLPDKIINGVIFIDQADEFKDQELQKIIDESHRLLIKGGFIFMNFLPKEPIPTKYKFNLDTKGVYTLLEGPEKGRTVYLRENKLIERFFAHKFLIVDLFETKSGRRRVLAKRAN